MRALAAGARRASPWTLLDGLVLARSAFHHSMNYRSVVVLGVAEEGRDEVESWRPCGCSRTTSSPDAPATPAAVAGRARPHHRRRAPLTEASPSAHRRPERRPDDLDLPVWAGVVPLALGCSATAAGRAGAAAGPRTRLRHPLPPP
jgi:hypothetical protein